MISKRGAFTLPEGVSAASAVVSAVVSFFYTRRLIFASGLRLRVHGSPLTFAAAAAAPLSLQQHLLHKLQQHAPHAEESVGFLLLQDVWPTPEYGRQTRSTAAAAVVKRFAMSRREGQVEGFHCNEEKKE